MVKIAAGIWVSRKRNLTAATNVGGVGRCQVCARLVKNSIPGYVKGSAASAPGGCRRLVGEAGKFHTADDHVGIDTLVGT